LEGIGGNRVEEMGGHGRGRGSAYLVNDIVLTGSSLARGRTTALAQTLGNIRAPDPAPVASVETPRGGRGQRPDVITSELPGDIWLSTSSTSIEMRRRSGTTSRSLAPDLSNRNPQSLQKKIELSDTEGRREKVVLLCLKASRN